MNDDDVTHVTRNRSIPPELNLLIDLATSAAILYYATHPDCLDGVGERARHYWARFVHHVSVWSARQAIRSLPETDK